MNKTCFTCACWYGNTIGEVRKTMNECGLECSQEMQEVHKERVCPLYQGKR